MNFPLERSYLYSLSKDMLFKLILTIQSQYKPENIKDDKLVGETKKYVMETFKRKTIVIKEYLKRYMELLDTLPYVKTFKLLPKDEHVVLSISFIDGRFIRCTQVLNNFQLSCFDTNYNPIYHYREVYGPSEEILQQNEMETCQKYIDFVKFLKHEQLVKRVFDYLNIYTNRKDFE